MFKWNNTSHLLWLLEAVEKKGRVHFIVYGAYTSFQDHGSSYGFGMKTGLPLFTDLLELEFRGGYFDNVAEDSLPAVDLIPLELGLSLNVFPGGRINPYVSAGGGYYFFDADFGSVDDTGGGYLGGGIEFRLTRYLALTGEVFYRYIADADYSESSDSFRDSAAVHAGLSLIW